MTPLTDNLPPVTEWFDGKTTVPGQPGLYQRRYKEAWAVEAADYWDGRCWYLRTRTGGDAGRADVQDRDWRGLTEEVKS